MSITLGALLPVGSVIHSMLTEAQFQAQAGSGWVLADGRSATGTVYNTITGASTIPDMTGRFLRGKGANNPDGSLALGTLTAAKSKYDFPTGGVSDVAGVGVYPGRVWPNTATVRTDGGNYITYTTMGANDTAPQSVTVNIFMRIN